MYIFILLAAALVLIAGALIALPMLRSRPALAPAVWTALACTAVLVLGSAVLYAALSNWSWHPSPGTHSPEAMVERLAHHLGAHPKDLEGWLMLGRSYLVLQEYPLAARAYARAVQLSGDNTQALLGEAQALILSDQTTLAGRAGDLVERALAHSPHDPQALFFGAVVALHRGELRLARTRFQQFLARHPPASLRSVAESQIAIIDRKLPPGTVSGARTDGSAAARAGAALIRVRLVLAPALAGRAPSAAPLYVFVRDPADPGPPLAVKRLRSHFPQTVVLRPQDTMVPGHAFTVGERVEVIARIAPSGNPLDQSGDLSGQTIYRVGHEGLAEIRIDHVTP